MSSLSWSSDSNMDVLSTDNPQEPRFLLMELPADVRNVIYRHALDHALPNLILPRWMHGWHEYAIGHPVASERPVASSFTNLQLSNHQVYQEASYILYQSRGFSFNIAPRHASFLDGCLLSGFPTRDIWDKICIHRITNIALKANWDEYDWADIRRFPWTIWKDITFLLCQELQGFSGLRRLTLDWKVPDPCEALQPTTYQWLSIFPYFDRLQARRPDICMEVLAWQMIPGSVPSQHRTIRTNLKKYAQELLPVTERPRYPPVPLPNVRYISGPRQPFVLPRSNYSSYQRPPNMTGLYQVPWRATRL